MSAPLQARPFRALGARKGQMDCLVLNGGKRLKGKVEISGSKNSSLPIMAACLMAEGKTTLRGVPRLSDIDSMSKLLGDLGCHVYRHEARESVAEDGPPLNGPLDITVSEEKKFQADYEIVRTMRASICTMGPLLAKRKKAIVSIPGGCNIGDRPIDLHVRGMVKLGAEYSTHGGYITLEGKGRLTDCRR